MTSYGYSLSSAVVDWPCDLCKLGHNEVNRNHTGHFKEGGINPGDSINKHGKVERTKMRLITAKSVEPKKGVRGKDTVLCGREFCRHGVQSCRGKISTTRVQILGKRFGELDSWIAWEVQPHR